MAINPGTSPRKRMQSMDALKFLAIFCVLWGHSAQYLISGNAPENIVFRFVRSFNMPLFMMIAGFFFAMTLKPGFRTNVANKVRELILPALVWGCIDLLATWIISPRCFSPQSVRMALYDNFWFLYSAFLCSMLGLLPFKLFKSHSGIAVILTLLISQLLYKFPAIRFANMYPAFLVGAFVFKYHETFRKNLYRIIALGGAIWLLCLYFYDSEAYLNMMGFGDYGSRLEHAGWILYQDVMGISGGLALMALFGVIFRVPRGGSVVTTVTRWGSYTLGIYILQNFILERILPRYLNFDAVSGPLFDFVVSPLVSLAVMSLCVGITCLIRLSPAASFILLGGRAPKLESRH